MSFSIWGYLVLMPSDVNCVFLAFFMELYATCEHIQTPVNHLLRCVTTVLILVNIQQEFTLHELLVYGPLMGVPESVVENKLCRIVQSFLDDCDDGVHSIIPETIIVQYAVTTAGSWLVPVYSPYFFETYAKFGGSCSQTFSYASVKISIGPLPV